MKKILLFLLILPTLFLNLEKSVGQGLNHAFLLGYTTGLDTNVTSRRGQLSFDNANVTVYPQNFKMGFRAGQANICNEAGGLLMYTNGCWVADATGDTMQNGSGLNPGAFADDWCDATSGIPYVYSSIFLPWPGDSSKYILFHQTGNYNLTNTMSSELFYSTIDITQNGGLGSVTQKNVIGIQDTLNAGITACKHANGRDWWIVILKDNSDIVYTILLTPSGISNISIQNLGLPNHTGYNGQPQFSPDGSKFAYHHRFGVINSVTHQIGLLSFDRCTGLFSNPNLISFVDSVSGFGLSFSSNSKYLYFSTFTKIFQVKTDTSNVLASMQTIASYDGYCFPYSYLCTTFWPMYLASNGKIYLSSGTGTIDLNYINSPDSSGIACDVQQHALRLPCYIVRANVNHPNYYLGPLIGSPCDSLPHVGLQEHGNEIQNFKLSPNPSNGNIKIVYLLPQNQKGIFEVYDMNGKNVFMQSLPQWSSIQNFSLTFLEDGLYQCVIRSAGSIATQKLMVVRN